MNYFFRERDMQTPHSFNTPGHIYSTTQLWYVQKRTLKIGEAERPAQWEILNWISSLK